MNIVELAAELGLSVSTVSKALNGRHDVSAKTRERVQEAARRYGFTPDPAARRLRTQMTETVAFVLSAQQTAFASPFFVDMLVGVNEVMDSNGYQVIVASPRGAETEIDLFKRLIERRRIDALIFGRTRRQDERIAFLLERDIPFVAFGRSETSDEFPYLDIDHRVVGRAACARFIALGHRRIALLHAQEHLMSSHLERLGYEEALRAAGIEFDPALRAEAAMTEQAGAAAAGRLLNLEDPPTAFVCGHDLIALGVTRAISEAGKVPGRDIGVIGGDNHPIGRYVQPALTTFSADTDRAGRRMAEMLLERLSGKPAKELQEIWAPELIGRGSDGPQRINARYPSNP